MALRRLGIGTIAAPVPADDGRSIAATTAPACTPIGTVEATAPTHTVNGFVPHTTVRPHRSGGDPPLVRGPPSPLESPSSPIAAAGSSSAATGGVSGDRDCATLAGKIAFTLDGDDGGCVVAADCCDYVAPAPAKAAARAPPVA